MALHKNGSSLFPNNLRMNIGEFLQSPNGRYKMILDDRFNLKIYEDGNPIWAADKSVPYTENTELNTHKGESYVLQGAYSLYIADFYNKRTWSTKSSRNVDYTKPGRTVGQLQDDGNYVIVRYEALWSSNPDLALVPEATSVLAMNPGFRMTQGQEYKVGPITFIFQSDGNLVSYDQGMNPVWNSGTVGQGADLAVMQEDGNFVIYNSAQSRAVWNSQTSGNPGAYAMVTDNGRFTVVKTFPIWARFGFIPDSPPSYSTHGVNLGEGVRDSYTTYKLYPFFNYTF